MGLWDAFGGNHLSSYEDTYEQAAYLHGRMVGDAAGMVQGGQEITNGGAFALATAETGGGAIAGGGALHGAGMELVASKDIAWSLARLYQLNFAAVSDGSSSTNQNQSPTGPTNSQSKPVNFSKTPKATELRAWAKSKGYKLLSDENGIETWGESGQDGWRLKIKRPSTTPGIHPGSMKWRFSARTKPGEYYDPVTGQTGSRSNLGHLDVDPN
ncbi:MAG: hypothetical protein P4L51_22665 [Puia sp.]|nr:hypothetical protein [Puia sp.]